MADEPGGRLLYLVEHDLRDLSPSQLAEVYRALGEAVRRAIRRGSRIRYVQRIYAPDEQRCLCLFEATGPEVVRAGSPPRGRTCRPRRRRPARG